MLKKAILSLASLTLLFMFAVSVWAKAPEERPNPLNDRGPLTKITFIHYRRGFAKPDGVGNGNGNKKDSGPSCYGFLAKGVEWKNFPRDIYVNSTGSGMNQNDVLTGTEISANTWDSELTATNLFGSVYASSEANWDDQSPDYKNEVSFGNYNSGVIAVTNVWGYFSGPPQTREIVEFDILFNTDYAWGNNSDSNVEIMDFQNIATHELGHGWGLDDIYDTSCSAVTMYGYSDYGDIEKRTLEQPDIDGLQSLYN